MRCTIIILLFTMMHSGLSWRPYKVRVSNLHGECLDNLCNATLTTNKTSYAIGFDFETDNEFDPFTFNLVVSMINGDKTEKVLFNKSIDLCAYLRNKHPDQLFAILYNDMKNYGNIVSKCPVQGHFYVNNFILDTDKLPLYMPVMKLRIDGSITAGFANEKDKQFTIVKFTVSAFVDNTNGVNRLIKING